MNLTRFLDLNKTLAHGLELVSVKAGPHPSLEQAAYEHWRSHNSSRYLCQCMTKKALYKCCIILIKDFFIMICAPRQKTGTHKNDIFLPHAYVIMPPKPKFLAVSRYDKLFSNRVPIWSKSHQKTEINLTCSRSKVHLGILHVPLMPNFRLVNSMMNRFWVWHNLKKRAPNDSKMTLTCSRSEIPKCIPHDALRPNFCLFRSTVSCCWVMAPLLRKGYPMTPNDMFKGKGYPYARHIPLETQLFVSLGVFNIFPNSGRSAPNNTKLSKTRNQHISS